jgi:hypothetical protein
VGKSAVGIIGTAARGTREKEVPMGAVGWVVIVVVVVGIVIALFGWDRYRGNRKRAEVGAQPTDEVFIDPNSGKRTRVWYNAATGEREYRPD